MTLIIGLVILGLIFITFEIIVPGGVLGVLGGVSIIAACATAYDEYGVYGAVGVFIGSLVLVIITLTIELKYLPKTKIGARMFLKQAVDDQSTTTLGTDDIVGKTGEALTALVPTGKIMIEGKSFEGFSQDGLIDKGVAITVVARDNFRIIVKKS